MISSSRRLESAIHRIFHPYLTILLICLLIGAALYGLVSSVRWPLIHDAPMMHYIAEQILHGAVPYKDLYDLNYPGTYLIHLFVLTVLGKSSLAWRIFDLAWLAAAGILAGWIASRYSKWAGWIAPPMVFIYHLTGGSYEVGQRDFFLGVLLLAAGFFLALAFDGKRSHLSALAAGFFLGYATIIKPVSLLMFLFLACLIFYEKHRKKNPHAGPGWLVLGAAIAPAAAMLWLIWSGGIAEFVSINLNFVFPIYSKSDRIDFLQAYNYLMAYDSWYCLLLAALLPLGLKLDNRLKNPSFAILLIGVGYGLLHFFIQGRGWVYHADPLNIFLFPVLAILIGIFLEKYLPLRLLASFTLITAAFMLIINLSATLTYPQSLAERKPAVRFLLQDIAQAHLSPQDTVQVLDTADGGIEALFLLNIQQPTRFIYQDFFAMMPDDPYIKGLRAEFIQDLVTCRPELIVIFGAPGDPKSILNSFSELAQLLSHSYMVSVQRGAGAYTIYQLKDRDPSNSARLPCQRSPKPDNP